jgi:cell division protein ZapA
MKALVHTLDIGVNGRSYSMACPPGEEARLRQLADFLDDRVRKLSLQFAHAGTSISESKLLVMAALMLVDELAEANNRLATYEEQAGTTAMSQQDTEMLTSRIQRLTARINSIAEKVMA